MITLRHWNKGLACLVWVCFTVNTYAEAKKEISPLSHTYTHDLIENVQAVVSKNSIALLKDIQRLNVHWDHAGMPIAANLCLPLPFMILEGGIDGVIPNEIFSIGFKLKDYPPAIQSEYRNWFMGALKNNVRGSIIFKLPSQYLTYLRFARDYAPFGNPMAEAIGPQSILTHADVSAKAFWGEIGGKISTPDYQVRGSVAIRSGARSMISNLQYERTKATQIMKKLAIERCIVGNSMIFSKVNFVNLLYSHIHLSKALSVRMEGYIPWNLQRSALGHSAYHVEVSQDFKQIPMIDWSMPWTWVIGTARGLRGFTYAVRWYQRNSQGRGQYFERLWYKPRRHTEFFGAVKLKLWQNRITLLGGAQYVAIKDDQYPDEGWGAFFRVGVSL